MKKYLTIATALFLFSSLSYALEGYEIKSYPNKFLTDAELPKRHGPIVEIGDPFYGTGMIRNNIVLPTGAVFNPRLMVFGNFRSSIETFRNKENGSKTTTDIPFSLNLLFNLQLSGTERILLGINPFVQNGEFSRYIYHPKKRQGITNNLNLDITTLFFEGDIGEIFPNWEKKSKKPHDHGFAIGRQGFIFQEGIFINDTIDGFGVTQNSLHTFGAINAQHTFYYGFNNIERNNSKDDSANLFGYHARYDTYKHTIDTDIAYINSPVEHNSGGDMLVFALSSQQEQARWGTTFRVLSSIALDEKTIQSDSGTLLFFESNYLPCFSHDIIYLNAALSLGDFTSLARAPTAGGALGRLGILFASPQLSVATSPIAANASHNFSISLGYQKYISDTLQLTTELGGKTALKSEQVDALGIAILLEKALTKRTFARLNTFYAANENTRPAWGLRFETFTTF